MNNKKESFGKLSCFSRASRKKGISAIVATVLIILITVAAVTIIWAAIIPMINNQLDSSTVCLDAVSQVTLVDAGYTCWNDDATGPVVPRNVSLQIRHGAKDFVLADIQVLVSAGGTTTSFTVLKNGTTSTGGVTLASSNLPDSNEEKVFVLNDTSAVTGTIDKIQIAPIVKTGAVEQTCDVSATKMISKCTV